MQAESGDTVKVHYTGTLIDGTEFDSSHDGEPLEFTIGQGLLISKFEEAVIGMVVEESKTITIPAAEAYGFYREDLVFIVERSTLPDNIAVGQQLQMMQANGNVIVVTVTSVSEQTATVDANHPLAGEDLTFKIELVAIER
ncbi:MAG: FKBP-type peptidyl-prolyl cis-trans isomerase [Dehalococcoidia bacterium]|nr:MAG: FKBP-type peptidyl-prolyl cis-trans isomerase [Dehalococcoidia bacterium]